MLKQLLATSALVVIGAVFIQSASAADLSKLREIVVEQAGAHAPEAAAPPAPSAGKVGPSALKPGWGIPPQVAEAGGAAAAANSAALGGKPPVNQLVVTPPSGISTPAAGGAGSPAG